MDNNKAFLVYSEYEEHLKALSDAEWGRLFKAMFAHNAKRDLPQLSKSANMAFSFIRAQMDRNEEKYAKKCAVNKENGAKGGRPKNEEPPSQKPKKTERFSEKPKKPDKDKDKDKDISSVEDNTLKPPRGAYAEIVGYLNERTGKRYTHKAKATQSHINARLTEGFTLDDFIKVIDVKCAEWLGTDMEKFLRPETLFGTKFDGYLNQAPRNQAVPKRRFIQTGVDEYGEASGYWTEETP